MGATYGTIPASLTSCYMYTFQMADLNGRLQERTTELEELKGVVTRQKADQKKLLAGMSEMEQLNQTIER